LRALQTVAAGSGGGETVAAWPASDVAGIAIATTRSAAVVDKTATMVWLE